MRRILPALLMAGSALACLNDWLLFEDDHHHHHHHTRHLAAVVTPEGKPPTPPFKPETRSTPGWSYKPNYNYVCDSPMCCGVANDSTPARQPCGPELWRFLDDKTATRCVSDGVTNQQSPINFMTEGPSAMNFTGIAKLVGNVSDATPVFTEEKCEGEIEFMDNTWEIKYDDKCKMGVTLLGKKWKLLQFHFHNSEHTVNSMYLPLEVHMVHKNDDGDLLVLGVFLTPGQENEFFATLEATNGNAGNETRLASPYDVVPDDRKYWHYKGSLTTPPCQRADGTHVEWFVFQEPVQVSLGQLAFFSSFFKSLGSMSYNGQVNRPVQPLASSTVVYEFEGANTATAKTTPTRHLRPLA